MPLYELILITRCSKPSGTANLMRKISNEIFAHGGNVRGVSVLGDRILTKKIIANDEGRHIVGRYVQILYDSHPKVEQRVRYILITGRQASISGFRQFRDTESSQFPRQGFRWLGGAFQ
jgi:ribosomal protein S6